LNVVRAEFRDGYEMHLSQAIETYTSDGEMLSNLNEYRNLSHMVYTAHIAHVAYDDCDWSSQAQG
jgi:hypothetical protein